MIGRLLRRGLDAIAPAFGRGGRLHRFRALYDAADTLAFTPGTVTRTASHVRDGLDLKRMMTIVIVSLLPCIAMAVYNTGYQAQWAIANGAAPLDDWRMALYTGLGLPFDHNNPLLCIIHGLLYFGPVLAICLMTGVVVEVTFAVVRGHDANEGFFVTGFLIPLILPPAIPLWQVVIGTAFSVVFAKEVFGGTGMNFLNPALVARAFLFFAYPAAISGDAPWIAANFTGVDGFTGATLLSRAAMTPHVLDGASWLHEFLGRTPGSMGETSTLACLMGAAVLLWTRIASWRTMLGVVAGSFVMATSLRLIGSDTNLMVSMPFHWHVVLGGWAFGTVFMATDPVSSAVTDTGKLLYGAGIGVLVILIRTVNPAYPEGMMLAILFMNMLAPLVDHFVVRANIRRRKARYAA